jgi:hypothetical protein
MTDASPPTTPGTSGTPAAGARASRGASIAVAVLFGLVYSYYLWDAIRSFIELPAQLDAFGYGRENAPWTLLVIGVLLPIVGYLAAFVIGRRRALGNQAIIFFVGLCAVACLGLGVIALG